MIAPVCMHGFEASLEQQLFEKRIADLHVGTLGLRSFAEFLAGHRRAVDAVAPRLCADVDHRIAFAGGARVKDFVFAHQAHGECIYQRVARVAGLEFSFAAEVGDSEAVAVGGYAADYAFEDGVIAVDVFLGCDGLCGDSRGGCPYVSCYWAEP